MKNEVKLIALAGLLMSAPAFAEDKETAPELRELVSCFPAKGITKFISKFQKLDADKRDTVDMVFDAKFEVKDDGVLPSRVFLRDNGRQDNFQIDADGKVTDFLKIGQASETTELCSEDPSRVGQPKSDDTISFALETDVMFLQNSGYDDLATLNDGLKDGKSHFKKMVPAPMRLIVPKMSHVMINYEAEDVAPQFAAMKNGAPVEGLTSDEFCKQTIIKVKDLEALGAEGLQISGGAYTLMPVPNKKMLEKFVKCGDEENEDEKE